MSTHLPFPHDAKIKAVLEMLFDKKVSFERGEPLQAPACAAILRRDDGSVHGCIFGDQAMIASFGALLSMSPSRVAREELVDGKPTPISKENVYEIANVLSSLYNASGAPHVKLGEVSFQTHEVMDDIQPVMDCTGRKAHLVVTIGDYPVGRMTLAILEEGMSARKVEIRSGPAVQKTGFDAWR